MGSVTQHQQLQHVTVSRKRSSNQDDNGCSGKSKKTNENTETTEAGLTDGANMTIEVEQVTVLSQQCISSWVRKVPSLFSCRNNSVVLLRFRRVKRERSVSERRGIALHGKDYFDMDVLRNRREKT